MDHLDLAIRFDTAAGDEGEFAGYAALWDERNAHNETVQRGAFRRSLQEHRAVGTRPVMLWSHNPAEIIGVWTEVREDEKGLAVTGKIVTTTVRGREAYDLLKAGALNGLSIGFRARGDKRGPNGIRVLTDIDVREISLVGNPSASRARILSIRNHGRPASAAAFVEACRKARCALAPKGQ
ncbi:HK97 family phage prohead protease [Antarcticirhabdus aurantiaca]|uniref:HK97 family phage prohead protease n=1 Tax=Antarcticirhabdus aurantiaca TaxID=2606717 RepID=A0ACD4NVL3_9HYPH|nr:HK97 family phage prohead protease [Jeongeuplla avenae]